MTSITNTAASQTNNESFFSKKNGIRALKVAGVVAVGVAAYVFRDTIKGAVTSAVSSSTAVAAEATEAVVETASSAV